MRSLSPCPFLASTLALIGLGFLSPPDPLAGWQVELPATQLAESSFRHDRHADIGCLECHAMQLGHGTVVVREANECRSCHHAEEQEYGCAACHQEGELGAVVQPQRRFFTLSVLEVPQEREVDFSHQVHAERECEECHVGGGPSLSPTALDCQSCHQEHHLPTSSACDSCHLDPPDDAHPLEVHDTCSGAGCHVDPPFDRSPPTRVGCLWCHQEQVDHEPEGSCVDCHFVTIQAQNLSPGGPSFP